MMIEIKNLKFKYANHKQQTLNIPAFQMKKNEKVFLFGPSGCGKTTFLEALAGVIQPASGQILIAGQDIVPLSQPEKDRVRGLKMGYIFQNFNLIPYLNAQENILLPLQLIPEKIATAGITDLQSDLKKISQKLGIESLLQKNVTELSVGQQQRVAAARALIGRPQIILADEPTSALDFDHREKFVQLLFEMANQQQTAILFVSHDRSLQNLFDRSVQFSEMNSVEAV